MTLSFISATLYTWIGDIHVTFGICNHRSHMWRSLMSLSPHFFLSLDELMYLC